MIPLGNTYWQNSKDQTVVKIVDHVQDAETDETVLIFLDVPNDGMLHTPERKCMHIGKFLKCYYEVQKTYGWAPTDVSSDRQPVLRPLPPSRPTR